jgi:hypothetical protein
VGSAVENQALGQRFLDAVRSGDRRRRIDGDKIVEHWGGLREAERFYEQLTGEAP